MAEVNVAERPDNWYLSKPLTFDQVYGDLVANSDTAFSLVLDKYTEPDGSGGNSIPRVNSVRVKYITGNIEGVQIVCKENIGEARGKQVALFGLICIKLFLFDGVLMEEL